MMTYEEMLLECINNDDRYMVLTAENRAAIRNLPQQAANNFLDVGISEQTMIGAAAGLALRGRIPVVHALSTFLVMRAFEFIRTDVGISGLPVKLVGAVPGFLSEANGPTHQAVEDIGLMRLIPNMEIFTPADEYELLGGLKDFLASQNPGYLRFVSGKPVFEHAGGVEKGKAEIIQQGNDITLFTYGYMFTETMKAKYILEESGFSVGLVNMRYLNPVDEDAIINVIKNSYLNVIIEDHFINGGLYSIVAETLMKNKMTANIMPVALNNKWFKPALIYDVLEYEGFTGKQIADKVIYAIKNKIAEITD
jgi:transketolase